jgi:hypothetical protein
MRGTVRHLCGVVLGATLGGCLQHQDAAMRGNADYVSISYAGDASETTRLARQHCAQYERQPVLRSAADNVAVYACVRADGSP